MKSLNDFYLGVVSWRVLEDKSVKNLCNMLKYQPSLESIGFIYTHLTNMVVNTIIDTRFESVPITKSLH